MDAPMPAKPRSNLMIIIIMLLLLILLAGLAGWLIAKNNNKDTGTTNTPVSNTSNETVQSSSPVSELVSYTLPNGWTKTSCDGVENLDYFVRGNEQPDCSDEPKNAITLAVDPQSHTDCNQLQNVQDVSKHICKSIFIDNHKTLQAQTIYNQDSDILPGRTVDAYYMDTGNGVVVARYIHTGDADDGTAFNDLVQSLHVIN